MTRHPSVYLMHSALMGAVVALAAGVVSAPSQAASGADSAPIAGTLLVSPGEGPDQPPVFAVETYDGTLVQVTGPGLAEDNAGLGFQGTVALPDSLDGATGDAALRRAASQHVPLRVTSSSLAKKGGRLGPASKGTAHAWYVAAPSNFGDQGMTDTDLMKQVNAVAAYWKSESGSAISKISVPKGIVRYTATATSPEAGCGMSGSDFWSTVQEASAQFPKANFGGADQLLVLMPARCAGTGITGRASLNTVSFAHGGYSILRTDPRWFQQSLTHELGHNYGFDHSRLGPCEPTCDSDYGDLYSVMGGAVTNFNRPTSLSTAYRVMQGITVKGEVQTLAMLPGTKKYTLTIKPRSTGSGLRSVVIPASANGAGAIYLDYRSGGGTDKDTYYTKSGVGEAAFRPGLVAEVVNNSTGIALMPDNGRKAITVGQTRYIAGGAVTVKVNSVTPSGLTVTITITGGTRTYPGTGKVQLSASPTVGSPVTAVTSDFAAGSTLTYQWMVDGTPIAGATTDTFTPTGALMGRILTVSVTATLPGYLPGVASTTQVAVAGGTLVAATPTITGSPVVGQVLTADPGAWTPGTTFTYQWYASSRPVAGATNGQLTLTSDLRGKKLYVVVTGSQPGYTAETRTSTLTGTVAAG